MQNIVDGNYDAKRKNHIGGRRFSPSQDQGCYGFTEKSASPPGVFNIHISAQLIWPLLVPEYSESEKLCSHFMIAVTLLHELMVRFQGTFISSS